MGVSGPCSFTLQLRRWNGAFATSAPSQARPERQRGAAAWGPSRTQRGDPERRPKGRVSRSVGSDNSEAWNGSHPDGRRKLEPWM